jgi:hypothetical protein
MAEKEEEGAIMNHESTILFPLFLSHSSSLFQILLPLLLVH